MKVVGILPTRGRPEWAARAVACFLAQDYPDKQLVIVDDEDEPSFPGTGMYTQPSMQLLYRRLPQRLNIPQKRNYCCQVVPEDTDVIAHFDSDDYSSPDRLSSQMRLLQESKLSVTGFSSMLFYDAEKQKAWLYRSTKLGIPNNTFALGSSLMYTRAWWQKHKWNESKLIGSDNAYVKEAAEAKQLVTVEGVGMMVARVHAGNTSFKHVDNPPYKAVDVAMIPEGFFA